MRDVDQCVHPHTAFSWVLDEYENPLGEIVVYCEICKENLEYIKLQIPLKDEVEQNYLECIYKAYIDFNKYKI